MNVAVLGCRWAGRAHLKAYQKNRNINIASILGISFENIIKVAKVFDAKSYDYFYKIL